MTQLSSVTHATTVAPQAVTAPLASVADRPFAYVLRGLVGVQLARPAPAAPPEPKGMPVVAPVVIGPRGPATIGAFTLGRLVLTGSPTFPEIPPV
ncbi:hypothetical protein [Cryptosporangium aurantiacum]|uniref:Uncharacterized protein n=1 Tax=Cryptosporangium aurantiacum TaxID=134849 RepID=A0A1M7RAW0_9ACTN|nr:hypothetical protein [Cryptosporangium aurantiacum]SHN43300.1 hypothetical protein SAMN05443668_109108 [Cryptosporangium aurantiacum]